MTGRRRNLKAHSTHVVQFPEIISAKAGTVNPATVEPSEKTVVSHGIEEDSFVYVHGHIGSPPEDMLIRIWKTTYLIDKSSNQRSELVHIENISYAPQWTFVRDGRDYSFLLIFSSLPQSCIHFDLLEEINLPGGFFVPNIVRNPLDVYHVNIF